MPIATTPLLLKLYFKKNLIENKLKRLQLKEYKIDTRQMLIFITELIQKQDNLIT